MRDFLILFLGCIFGTCIALVVLGLCFAARDKKPKPKTVGFLLGTDLFCVAEANKKLGYKRGVDDLAAKLENALPRDCIVLAAVIDQAAKELKEKEDAKQ